MVSPLRTTARSFRVNNSTLRHIHNSLEYSDVHVFHEQKKRQASLSSKCFFMEMQCTICYHILKMVKAFRCLATVPIVQTVAAHKLRLRKKRGEGHQDANQGFSQKFEAFIIKLSWSKNSVIISKRPCSLQRILLPFITLQFPIGLCLVILLASYWYKKGGRNITTQQSQHGDFVMPK